MRPASLIPVFALALAAAGSVPAQDARPGSPSGFDEALGLWFPPGTPKEAYLRRDPEFSFADDVRRAFLRDPALREAVCGRLISAGSPQAPEASIAQLRVVEDMICLSLAARERTATRQAEKDDAAAELLSGWFAEERSAAEKWPPAERRRREYDLRNSAADLPKGNERARAGVRMIALRPSDDLAIAFLLDHGPEARFGTPRADDIEAAGALPGDPPRFSISKAQIERFVTDLYRTMISGEGDAAGPFRSGWAGYLHLSGGDLREARKLAAAFVSDPLDDNPAYETVFVAYLDRLLGDRAPLDALVERCPFAAPDAVAASVSANYCRTAGWSLASRLIEVRGKDASPVAAEIVREAIRAEPANWVLRLASIRALDRVDPLESAREYRALAELPATAVPDGVRLDALAGVMTGLTDAGDHRGALEVNRRWLDTYGYRPAPLPADGWARLAATDAVAASDEPCPDALACMLSRRIGIALALKDRALARRTLEERLAYTLGRGFPEETRMRLVSLAQAEIDDGRRPEALRIVRYLWPQPHDPVLAQLLRQQRGSLSPKDGPLAAMTREASPWDSAAAGAQTPPRP